MKIFADSASDLPFSYFQQHQIELIPLKVIIEGQTYEDLLQIEPIRVYDTIRAGGRPTTAQASLEQLITLWTELAQSGEAGIYVAFSSNLSGTYATAEMAKQQVLEEYPDLQLTIIDTKAASLGYGLIVRYAAELRDAGHSFDDIVTLVQERSDKMGHLFTVDDLDYLAAGGRVSKASAFVGGLLNIKPLLHVDDGFLVPLEKIRGKKKLLNRMVEIMLETAAPLDDQVIGISHGDDLQLAEQLKQKIEEVAAPKEFQIEIIGATVASHTGPGTVALFYVKK